MTEVRTSKQVEISEIDGRLQEDYQARLQSALQDLRDHYEAQMQQNRDEIAALYQNKIQNLEEQAAAQRNASNTHYEELLQARTKLDGYNSKMSELESANNHLKVLSYFNGGYGSNLPTFVFSRSASVNWRRAWIKSGTRTEQLLMPFKESSIDSAIR